MTQEFTDDDGFAGAQSSRLIKGVCLRWNDRNHWHDRDGLAVPLEMLLLGIREVLQRFNDGSAELIDNKPLPSPEDLNATIPKDEWRIGIDGKPEAPWQHTVAFYLANPATGETYTFASATTGAHMAFEHIRDAVTNMRALRGAKVLPLVRLSERPMKTKHGLRTRPHLEPIGWKHPGEDFATPPSPQAGPIPSSTAAPSEVHEPTPPPTEPISNPAPRRPKSSIDFTANDTLAAMCDRDSASMADKLNDESPWK